MQILNAKCSKFLSANNILSGFSVLFLLLVVPEILLAQDRLANVDFKPNADNNLLKSFEQNNQSYSSKDAINSSGEFGWTPMMLAVGKNRLDVVELLASKNADVNARLVSGARSGEEDLKGYTPLILAARYGTDPQIIQKLIEKGADIEAKDAYGMNALMRSAATGKADFVRLLVEKGVIVNTAGHSGQTPLMFAVLSDDSETVKFLLENKSKVNSADESGNTALMLARSKKIAQLLLDAGADISLQNENGDTAQSLAAKLNLTEVERLLNSTAISKGRLH